MSGQSDDNLLAICRALFPPGTDKATLQPKGLGLEREAVNWFHHVYPRTQEPDWPTARPIDVIQVHHINLLHVQAKGN